MKDIVDCFSAKMKQRLFFYTFGLILNQTKKTCTQLAKEIKKKHDFLYKYLCSNKITSRFTNKLLKELINYHNKIKSGWLVVDDTFISKVFSKLLIGTWNIFNAAMSRPERGLCIVVLAWSNGLITIPLKFQWYYPKVITGDHYKKKSIIALEMILSIKDKINYDYLLADGHFSTIEHLQLLKKHNIKFLMKIARNRNVETKTSGKMQLQLQPSLKLLRNSRNSKVLAYIGEDSFYFSCNKRKNKKNEYSTVYLVSNMNIKAKDYLKLYEGRWWIEVMFRTMKQSLGLQDCQSRSVEKQKKHFEAVFIAYAILQNIKFKHKLKNSEAAERYLLAAKNNVPTNAIALIEGEFQCFA